MFSILIVDDDMRYLKFIKTMFEINGLSAHIAESSEEALNLIEEMKFDLLLTDYMMPLISGVELASIVSNKTPDLPIIMITGAPTKKLSELAKEAGIKIVLDKAIPPGELVRTAKEEYIRSKLTIGPPLAAASSQEKPKFVNIPTDVNIR